jgi:hypothetical protein
MADQIRLFWVAIHYYVFVYSPGRLCRVPSEIITNEALMFAPVSLDQAIEIHAKAAISRVGRRAEAQTLERARHCEARGDMDGFSTWTKVADGIQHLKKQGYKPRRLPR